MTVERRHITGFSNPTVKALRALREKKHRKAAGRFLAEGLRLLTDARECGHVPEVLVLADRREPHPLLATPTNLVAIARTVAQVWRQDKMADEARAIGAMGAELYDRLRAASEHLKRVGGGLESAVNNYNKFVGSFERNVLSSGRRMAEKGVEIGKAEIPDVPLVEATPRYNAEDAAQIGSAGTPESTAAD